MRQCESVWPEENRGKCFGTAAFVGGGAEGRGSRRFFGAPYGFALARGRGRRSRVRSPMLAGASLDARWCEGDARGCEARRASVRGRRLLVRAATLARARLTLDGAMADTRCEARLARGGRGSSVTAGPCDSASPYGRRKTVASALAQPPSSAAELRDADQGGFPERHTDSHRRAERITTPRPRIPRQLVASSRSPVASSC